eukprot:6132438-Amphidinium_carterae.1
MCIRDRHRLVVRTSLWLGSNPSASTVAFELETWVLTLTYDVVNNTVPVWKELMLFTPQSEKVQLARIELATFSVS